MKKNVTLGFLLFTVWCYGQNTEKIAKTALNSTVSISMTNYAYSNKILGSGFVVADNLVATNYHVISLGNEGYIQKSQTDTTHIPIKRIINIDLENDLALLEIENLRLPALAISTAELNIGEKIYVSGNPLGLSGTFSDGIVSANRKIGNVQAIQITAPISNGSSGGPVLNSDGKVVGVVFSSYRGGQNLNFVVPSQNLLRLMSKPQIDIPITKSINGDKVLQELMHESFNTSASKHIQSLIFTKGKMSQLDTKKGTYVYCSGNLQYKPDFELSARLKTSTDKQTCSYWGSLSDDPIDFSNGTDYTSARKYYTFCLKSGKASLGMITYEKYVKLVDDVILTRTKNGDFNVFKIQKNGDSLFFKINDELAFVQKYDKFLGVEVGMGAEEESGKILLDYVDMKQMLLKPKVYSVTDNSSIVIKLPESVNTSSDDCAPIVSLDGETLYFTRYDNPQNMGKGKIKEPDIYTIKLSEMGDKKIKPNNKHGFNNEYSNYCIGVSCDGSTVYFENLPEEDFGRIRKSPYLFGYSTVSNEMVSWANIKSYFSYGKYSSFGMSNERDVIIASLERPDTFGKSDLYISKKGKDGNWSEMRNLGPVINGLYDENSAFITADRKHIVFSSESHSGYGGSDIFVSERLDSSWFYWSEPRNLGPLINSKDDELSPFISLKTGELFFEKSDTLNNNSDLYRVKLNTTFSEGYTLAYLKFPQKKSEVEIVSVQNNFENKFKLGDKDWSYFVFNNQWEYKIKYKNDQGEQKEWILNPTNSIKFDEVTYKLE